MANRNKRVKNVMPTMAVNPINGQVRNTPSLSGQQTLSKDAKRNLSNYIAPVQLQRMRYDVRLWRAAVIEAEAAYYPHRVKMQQMFRDTALNGHVSACVDKRKRMTTLRDFRLFVGDVVNEEWTAIFKKKWFRELVSYCIDARNYGYSLISIGSIIDGRLNKIKLIQRWNVSPDRYNVGSYLYANNGKCFLDADVCNWHIYVDTPSEDGQSPCGYGTFYKIAIYEIILRNNLGFNTDFVERFSMPYVVAKTSKTNEDERGELENAVANMGSAGYALVDPMDEIEFLEAALAGTGWNGYDNLEQRLEKKISKMILGHSDAMDSTPGKLGGNQDGEQSPASKALSEIQSEDGVFMEDIINEQLLPKLKNIGFNVPDGLVFKYSNDDEKEEFRARQDNSNKVTAEIAKVLSDAGLTMSPEYFTRRTGIDVEAKEVEQPIKPSAEAINIQNKLDNLYN